MANNIPQGKWYDPSIYANEALIQLESALGMARSVHRGFDKVPQQRGSTIEVRRPGKFTSGDMPISTAEDIDPEFDNIKLDQWKGVVFALTDKEIGEAGQVIIDDHIRPAAFEMARTVDASLGQLFKDVPYVLAANSTNPFQDFTGLRRQFTDRKAPGENRWLMVGGEREEAYLNDTNFNRADGAGSEGINTQVRGALGTKFGITPFVNQEVPSHVEGTLPAVDAAGLTNGTSLKGDLTIAVDAFGAAETLKQGDILTIAGHTRQYAIGADAVMSTGAATLTLSDPRGLEFDTGDGVAVTLLTQGTNVVQNMAYQRNAFVLAMAPLTTAGNGLGVEMATVSDPTTSLALRSRIWYEAKEAKLYVGLDVLYGVKTLNPDLATRLQGPV